MLRLFIAFIISCFALGHAAAVWAAPAVSVPRPEHDFGTILQGENVRHVFTFTNRGDVPLNIEKVSSSCGCTAALSSAKTLAPGESGEIQTSFDSTRFRGQVNKTVYLYTNDPAQPMVQLQIKGNIQVELLFEPQVVNFGAVAAKRTVKSSVTLINQGKQQILLENPETTAPELAAHLSAEAIAPGGKASVELTLTPKPGQGRFSGYVLFKANGAISHDLRIPVYADLGDSAAALH